MLSILSFEVKAKEKFFIENSCQLVFLDLRRSLGMILNHSFQQDFYVYESNHYL